MNDSPAFQFYPADFLADENVAVMTPRQIGAYWLLCCHAWRGTTVGRLLNDRSRLLRLARLSESEWDEDAAAILACFDTSDPKWIVQKRLVKEWDKQQGRRNQAVGAGKASGKARQRTTVQRPFNDRSTESNPSSSSSSSSSSSVPPHPVQDDEVWGSKLRKLANFRHALNVLFNRPDTDQWGYLEESLLVQVSKRPDFVKELALIGSAKRKGGHFISISIEACLSDWQKNLDKARAKPMPNGKPQISSIEREVDLTLKRMGV